MKGHIRRRGKRSWGIVLDLGRDEQGQRRQKWHSVKGTRRDAEAELARLLNDFNLGSYVEPTKLTVDDFCQTWLRDFAKRSVSAKTYERYRSLLLGNVAPVIGHVRLSKLSPLQIQSFYTGLLETGRRDGKGGLSAQTVVHIHRLMHKAFGQAVRWQLLSRNILDAVEPPRVQHTQMKALDDAEVKDLLDLTRNKPLYGPVLIALATGLRRGEILALKWPEVDFEGGQVRVVASMEQTKAGLRLKAPKTAKSRRSVTLPQFAINYLRDLKKTQAEERLRVGSVYDNQDFVFAREDGSPVKPDTLSTNFATMIRRSNLPHVRFHDLRHTHATQLLVQGVNPKVVSERLGHSKVAITLDTYSHVMPGLQEDAARRIQGAMGALFPS